MTTRIPFLSPRPPRLSELGDELRAIEDSAVFTNYGPTNTRLEQSFIEQMFSGEGACVTVCNATIGLLIAIRAVVTEPTERKRFALMPSFTFAATAHAGLWCGLTPYFYDIEPDGWTPSAEAEEEILRQHADEIAVIVPYATFGAAIDLEHYERLSRTYGVPVVVDAAASLGSTDALGRGFGAGFSQPVVYSMHATKTFATMEGGLIYSADRALISRLRVMGNFGFGEPRTATMPGLNSKLGEAAALLGLAKLKHFDAVVDARSRLAKAYAANLPGYPVQRNEGRRQAHQFMSVLLPDAGPDLRREVMARMVADGFGVANYFSPHLAEHPYFKLARCADLSTTDEISRRILSLPMYDGMALAEVGEICDSLKRAVGSQ